MQLVSGIVRSLRRRGLGNNGYGICRRWEPWLTCRKQGNRNDYTRDKGDFNTVAVGYRFHAFKRYHPQGFEALECADLREPRRVFNQDYWLWSFPPQILPDLSSNSLWHPRLRGSWDLTESLLRWESGSFQCRLHRILNGNGTAAVFLGRSLFRTESKQELHGRVSIRKLKQPSDAWIRFACRFIGWNAGWTAECQRGIGSQILW